MFAATLVATSARRPAVVAAEAAGVAAAVVGPAVRAEARQS
jgi:hypothetical protein